MSNSALRRRASNWLACLTLVFGFTLAPSAEAQEGAAEAGEAAQEAKPAGPYDEFNRGVPRTSMIAYLQACRDGDYERATEYLDLRRLSPAQRAEQGPELARQLKVVLDKKLWVEPDTLSPDPEGHSEDGLSWRLDRVGNIGTREGDVDILIASVPRGDGVRIWKVDANTVARIPELYDEFGYGPLEQYLPAVFFEFRVLEISLMQWLALLLLIFLAWGLSIIIAALLVAVARPLVSRTQTHLDDHIFELMLAPLRLVLAVSLFTAGALLLGLAVPVREFLARVETAAIIIAVTWLVMRLADVFAEVFEERLVARGQEAAVPLIPAGRKTLKIVISLIGFIAVLDSFGFNVAALVAGLGVTGIAVALAAQKTIENLFGGIMLYADRPIRVGDFCGWDGRVGTVEEIGLRSTRVRTLDRTVVSIPNGQFSSMQVENYAKRDFIRFYTVIGLRYETTPEQARHVLVEVRKLLYAHEKVSPDPARIRFVGFGASSLDFEIFAYVITSDWNEFMGVREDLLLRIMDIVKQSGTGFAFPSRTLYLAKDDEADEARIRAAEAEVKAWREREQLYLPNFPSEQIQQLKGTVRFPPEGSPERD